MGSESSESHSGSAIPPQHSSRPTICPLPVRDYGYATEDAVDQILLPARPCGADLYLDVSYVIELADIGDEDPATVTEQAWGDGWWTLRCKNGHILVNGANESGDPIPFAWEMVPEGREQ